MNLSVPFAYACSLVAVLFFFPNLAVFNVTAQEVVAPKRYALLVGVTKYEAGQLNSPALQFPEKDASDLADRLRAGGYEVELLVGPNANKSAIERKLLGLAQKGNDEGAVVIGLFGHGVEYSGTDEAMFCPYDTSMRLARDRDGKQLFEENRGSVKLMEPDPSSLVGMSTILDAIRLCKAGNKLLLADCCRKSPNTARSRAFGSTVKLSDLPEGTAAIFACSKGQEALEHTDWQHGAMTKCFLDLLPELSNEFSDVNAITGRLVRSVSELVGTVSDGQRKQTVNPLVHGIVKLKISSDVDKSKASIMRNSTPSGTPRPDRTAPVKAAPPNTARRPGQSVAVQLSAGVELILNWIPAGTAKLGSPVTEPDREKGGQSESELDFTTSGFWIGKFETTQSQWSTVMGGSGAYNLPVSNVSYSQMLQFIVKLNSNSLAMQSPREILGDGKFSIPTEDQWEYACRGGLGNERAFYWGSTANGSEANLNGAFPYPRGTAAGPSLRKATTVGSYADKSPHPWGLCDMHGNVWEFCKARDSANRPVVRGGSYFDPGISQCRAAYRDYQDPTSPYGNMGFRIVYVNN